MTEKKQDAALVRHLYELADSNDRASLAALRAGLRPARRWDALRIVMPYVGATSSEWAATRAEDDALLIGGLFALHPEKGSASLATAMRWVKLDSGSESIETRFTAMLAASRDDLPDHLRHAVSLVAGSKGRAIGLDWSRLYSDIRFWSGNRTRRQWAREFWTASTPDAEEPQPASDNTPAG